MDEIIEKLLTEECGGLDEDTQEAIRAMIQKALEHQAQELSELGTKELLTKLLSDKEKTELVTKQVATKPIAEAA